MVKIDEYLTRAFQERQRDLPENAMRWFEMASELEPDNPAIRLEIARTHFDLAETQMGLKVLESIDLGLSGSPTDQELAMELARLWVRSGKTDRALTLYRSVPIDDNAGSQAILEAVLLLERTHCMDEALTELERHPSMPLRDRPRNRKMHYAAALAFSVLKERSGDLDAAAAHLKKIWKGASPSSGLAIECGYRLARILDQLDQPEQAIKTLRRCKKVERQQMPSQVLRDHVRNRRASDLAVLDELPDDWFDSRPAVNDSMRGIVLGHPRSGTTLLCRHLSKRSAAPWVDECPAFSVIARKFGNQHATAGQSFSGYLQSLSDAVVSQFESQYIDRIRQPLFQNGLENRDFASSRLIDKNPGLSNSLPALNRLLPGSAWIYLERDPRDVAASCYFQRFGTTPLGWACLSPNGALEAVLHTARLWSAVRERLTEDRAIVVRYEELVRNPDEVVSTTAAKLGWPTDGLEPLEPTIIHSPTYAEIRRPIDSRAVERWRRYEAFFAPFSEEQQRLMGKLGYG